ncbi:hypothetical protein HNQ91_002732 [Filimonas zeae]|uniref:Uncharacterized protein n=1 Tax=Filimonas zeae TaxID=1737353 RepID=A0A917IYM5_9BACT|nr:hypothetical protein [Filimonas zeae]MDR6339667.1 hypothetical protein [Filimonas zeae]GGH69052.1 hypothetical protein GCM10011379_25970 [Filimonas zeae]
MFLVAEDKSGKVVLPATEMAVFKKDIVDFRLICVYKKTGGVMLAITAPVYQNADCDIMYFHLIPPDNMAGYRKAANNHCVRLVLCHETVLNYGET